MTSAAEKRVLKELKVGDVFKFDTADFHASMFEYVVYEHRPEVTTAKSRESAAVTFSLNPDSLVLVTTTSKGLT